MRVLAIDPGYGRCGIAVLEKTQGAHALRYSHCIETDKALDFPDRLATVVQAIEHAISEYKPEALALERLYFTNNQKTAMRVAEVRGAIIALGKSAGLAVYEYGPGEIKVAAAGHGRADKKEVTRMLHMLVKIEKPIALDDEYDAIAIGVTHLASARVTAPAFR